MQKPSFGQNMTFQSANVTLKISSRSPKSNQLFPPSQNKKYACLVKIHLLFQKITNRNKAAQMPAGTPKGSASKSLCPPWVGAGGHKDNFAYICKAGDCSHDIFTYVYAH